MINKILDWILGKDKSADQSTKNDNPYKVETEVKPEVKVEETVSQTAAQEPLRVLETAPVTVKAKYKKTQLNKMSKKELLALANNHALDVTNRTTKDELVKLLSKVWPLLIWPTQQNVIF